VTTLQSSSSNFQLFQVFPMEALIFIESPEAYRLQTGLHVLLSEYCGTIGSPSSACQLCLCLGYVYFVTIAIAVAHHKQTTIFLTF